MASMGDVVDLETKLREAVRSVHLPGGVSTPPDVVLGEDSTALRAAWLLFAINERAAKPEQLLRFTRELESAAAKAVPGMVTYIRFRPASSTKRATSSRPVRASASHGAS